MKIISAEISELHVPLITPFITAERRSDEMISVVLRLHTNDGKIGYGEAPPVKAVTGETKETIISAVSGPLWKAVRGREITDLERWIEEIDHALPGNTSAKSAVDMALYDLYGQHRGLPLYKMFGAVRTGIDTDLTVSVRDPETMAQDAEAAVRRGFHTIKIKVGSEPEKDLSRLKAIRRAVGKEVRIRIDANQGWTPSQAVELLDQMQAEGIDLELVEQPAAKGDLKGLRYVEEHSSVPVTADESCFSPEDAERIFSMHAADFVNIKLDKCGGLHNALKIVDLAEQYGCECMLGCMLEGKVSVSAAVHLACSRKCITKIDLDGPLLCSEDPVDGGCTFTAPHIEVSQGPGLDIHGIRGLKTVAELK